MPQKIPFHVIEIESKSYHIIVEGKVEDTEVTLIIDTGASRTIFDSSYADRFGRIPIESENPIAAGLMAEQIPVDMICIPSLSLGKFSFKDVEALTADLSAINDVYLKLTGKRIDGLIGSDFLLSYIKNIDLVKKWLVLVDSEK